MIILKLDEILKEKNMTAYALHIKSGLHQSVISKIKRNLSKALQLDVLDKLCEALECSAGDLIVYQNPNATQAANTTQSEMLHETPKPTQSVKPTQIVNATQNASDNELLSTIQVADRLGVSRKSVNDYIIAGKLKSTKGKQNHNFIKLADVLIFEALHKEKS